MQKLRTTMVALVLAAGVMLTSAWASDAAARQSALLLSEYAFCTHRLNGEMFTRTELFFGLYRPGGVVSEEEFQIFIDTEVTPRFPDGLTLLSGKGQFKNTAGSIVQEGSKLLILLYPFSVQSSAGVEKIRELYKINFQQESVLRIDEQSCVSF